MANIKLTFTEDSDVEIRQSYDMQVTASDAVDMPNEVFVIQKRVAPAITVGEAAQDEFTSVADPLDIEEYPVSPTVSPEIPFYRVSMIALRFRSYSLMQETKALIISDVNGLVYAINQALVQPVTEEVVINGSVD